jgi:sodium-dependent dicarboxylate transporter 2/3/5
VAYGSNVGGIGTKIGTPGNSIFVGFVADKLGLDIGFAWFIALGFPFVVLFIPITWWVLWRVARRDDLGHTQGRAVIEEELRSLGMMSRGEKLVAVVFGLAAALWIFGDPLRKALAPWVPEFWEGYKFQARHYEALVAMGCALLLWALRGLSLRSLRRVPWGTLLVFGGSFALAAGIERSGLSRFMTEQLAPLSALPLFPQLLVASFASVGLSAMASNTAAINMMLNVLPPSLPVLSAATIATSCDFALPAGTPPNAIVFGSGYIRLPTMMKIGVVLDVASAVLIAVYVFLYARHLFPAA